MVDTLVFLFLAGPLTIHMTTHANAETADQQSLMASLQSSNWQVRYKALEHLHGTSPAEIPLPVREELIRLLAAEGQRRRETVEGKISQEQYLPPGANPREFADYYQALVDVVWNLHDPRALPWLVDYANMSGSESNGELAAYGIAVLDLVLKRMEQTSDAQVQGAMADILAHMLIQNRNHKLKPGLSEGEVEQIEGSLRPVLSSPNIRTQLDAAFALAVIPDHQQAEAIKAVFLGFLNDPSPGGRLSMLRRLERLEDAKFVPLEKVKELATRDDFRVNFKNAALRTKYTSEYPIRQLAREVLEKFSKKD
jgi:hypothetical protein